MQSRTWGIFNHCPFPRKVMQRSSLSSEVTDKSAIVTSQTTESVHLCNASWRGPRSDCGHFLWVTLDALSAYDMT